MGDTKISTQASIIHALSPEARAKIDQGVQAVVKEYSNTVRNIAFGGGQIGSKAGSVFGFEGARAGTTLGFGLGLAIAIPSAPMLMLTEQAFKGVRKLGEFIQKHPEALLASTKAPAKTAE